MPETKKARGANAQYEVGYKKPPKHTRFKKGQSGNARGRPKKKPQMPDLGVSLAKAFSETVAVNINGEVRRMTKLDLVMGQAVNQAAAGKLGQLRALLPFVAKYSDIARADAAEQRNGQHPEDYAKELEQLLSAFRPKPGKPQAADDSGAQVGT